MTTMFPPRRQQYQPPILCFLKLMIGAENRNRTCNPLLTREVLYQLSYLGVANGGAGGDLHPAWRHSKHVVLMFILARTVRLFIEFLVSFSAATTSDEVTGIPAIRLMVVSVYLIPPPLRCLGNILICPRDIYHCIVVYPVDFCRNPISSFS